MQDGQISCLPSASHISDKIFDAPCRTLNIPKALAMAIARVESNFRPWTLNIEGQSFFFASRAEALGKAREARKAGRSFDTVSWFWKANWQPPEADHFKPSVSQNSYGPQIQPIIDHLVHNGSFWAGEVVNVKVRE